MSNKPDTDPVTGLPSKESGAQSIATEVVIEQYAQGLGMRSVEVAARLLVAYRHGQGKRGVEMLESSVDKIVPQVKHRVRSELRDKDKS